MRSRVEVLGRGGQPAAYLARAGSQRRYRSRPPVFRFRHPRVPRVEVSGTRLSRPLRREVDGSSAVPILLRTEPFYRFQSVVHKAISTWPFVGLFQHINVMNFTDPGSPIGLFSYDAVVAFRARSAHARSAGFGTWLGGMLASAAHQGRGDYAVALRRRLITLASAGGDLEAGYSTPLTSPPSGETTDERRPTQSPAAVLAVS